MTKLLALSDNEEIRTQLTTIVEVAGFALEFVQQADPSRKSRAT